MQNTTLAKIALTAAVAVAGVAFLVTQVMGDAQHYKMVDELMAGDLSKWKETELKVHGWARAGTIKAQLVGQTMQRTFILQKGGKSIRVFSSGPAPDTFKDQSEVVATGHLVPVEQQRQMAASLGVTLEAGTEYVLVARDLQAKCPSKYEGARMNKDLNNTKFQ